LLKRLAINSFKESPKILFYSETTSFKVLKIARKILDSGQSVGVGFEYLKKLMQAS
jgi:hypothetical protein